MAAIEPDRGEVLAEHPARQSAPQNGHPVVDVLPGIGVDGLSVASVVAAVADHVADQATARSVALAADAGQVHRQHSAGDG
jgi:hypothetical protein